MRFKQTTKSEIISENKEISHDGYSSIILKNIGECEALINNNIPLDEGETFSQINEPYVEIDENTQVRFTGVEADKRVLVVYIYNSEY